MGRSEYMWNRGMGDVVMKCNEGQGRKAHCS